MLRLILLSNRQKCQNWCRIVINPCFLQMLQCNELDLNSESTGQNFLEQNSLLETQREDAGIADDDLDSLSDLDEIDGDEYNRCIFETQEDQVTTPLENDVLSDGHRLRILEQNTARWSLSLLSPLFHLLTANEHCRAGKA